MTITSLSTIAAGRHKRGEPTKSDGNISKIVSFKTDVIRAFDEVLQQTAISQRADVALMTHSESKKFSDVVIK